MGKPPLSYQFPGRLLANLADQGVLMKVESALAAFELPHTGTVLGLNGGKNKITPPAEADGAGY